MIRKFAGHDTTTPPATIVPAEGSKRLVDDLSRRVTWGRPLKGNETPEEAYARGWADAIAKYEMDQRLHK